MFDSARRNNDEVVLEKKQFERKELFIKRLQPHRSHKVFEYNRVTGEIKEAEFYNIPTITWEDAVNENFTKYRKIKHNQDCIYDSALNEKNFKKVLERDYNVKF